MPETLIFQGLAQYEMPAIVVRQTLCGARDTPQRQHGRKRKREIEAQPAIAALLKAYAAAMRRIRSSCSSRLSAPMVKASSTPSDSA